DPIVSLARYVDDPAQGQIDSLTTIRSRESVTIPFPVANPPGLGSRLITVHLDPRAENVALIYPLTDAGWYTFQFAYDYAGPDNGNANVFRGKLFSNLISFLIRRAKGDPDACAELCDTQYVEFHDTCEP